MITIEEVGCNYRVKVLMNGLLSFRDFKTFEEANEYRNDLLR